MYRQQARVCMLQQVCHRDAVVQCIAGVYRIFHTACWLKMPASNVVSKCTAPYLPNVCVGMQRAAQNVSQDYPAWDACTDTGVG